MKLLAVLHSPAGSGSATTILRIAGHLRKAGHSVLLAPDPGDPEALAALAHSHDIDMLIGTHALICAASFSATGLPYVIVFGGTDLNEYALDPEALATMTHTVDRAAALVAFNADFVRRCLKLWPHVRERLHHIPQGVETRPERDFSMRRWLGLPPESELLLLPSGLRPVKDPLMLVDCVRRWHEADPRIHLIIAGLSYDAEFEGIVRRRCSAGPGVRYVGPLPRGLLHAAMRESTAVLNTSLSECSPNAVLEAMRLHCPVVVRDIPGNTCLVRHGETGLVFDRPEEFRDHVQRLIDDPRLRAELGREAAKCALAAHGPRVEYTAYASVFDALAKKRSAPPYGRASTPPLVAQPVGGG
ncbi:glycosyltransferase [Streptomyces sp. NPDC091289]|uniref:glycosyltransferase n=1 Tax=Streptomyces sp. NPDC091289 TaxID=3365989 RepID=UPI00382806CD